MIDRNLAGVTASPTGFRLQKKPTGCTNEARGGALRLRDGSGRLVPPRKSMTSLEEVSASRAGAVGGPSCKIYKIYIENVQHGRGARLFAIQLLR